MLRSPLELLGLTLNPIKSATNPLFKKLKKLKTRSGRAKYGEFLIEGPKPIAEAIARDQSGIVIVISNAAHRSGEYSSLLEQLDNDDRITVFDDKLFAELVDTQSPQGILALSRLRVIATDELFPLGQSSLVIIAEGIQDPGNLGTIFRAAHGMKATGLILTSGTVDPYNQKVVRAASGAILSIPFVIGMTPSESIALCLAKKLQVIALSPEKGQRIDQIDLSRGTALILGNEGQGIDDESLVDSDQITAACIPLAPGCESLNVAMTASVVLYEAFRQRGFEI